MLVSIVVGTGVLAGVIVLAIDSGRLFGGTQTVQLATRSAVQALAQNCLNLDSQSTDPFLQSGSSAVASTGNGQTLFASASLTTANQYCGSATDQQVGNSTYRGAATLVSQSIGRNDGSVLSVCIWYRNVADSATASFVNDCAVANSSGGFSNVAYDSGNALMNPVKSGTTTPLCFATPATGGGNTSMATAAGFTNQPMVRVVAQSNSGPTLSGSGSGATQTYCSQAYWQRAVDGNAQPLTEPVMYPWIFPACTYSQGATVYLTDHDNSDSNWGNRIRSCNGNVTWSDGSTFSSKSMLDEVVGQFGFPSAKDGSHAYCGQSNWSRTERDGVSTGFLDNSGESDCDNRSSSSGNTLSLTGSTVQALLQQMLGQTRIVALGGVLSETKLRGDGNQDSCQGDYCGNYQDNATVIKFADLSTGNVVVSDAASGSSSSLYNFFQSSIKGSSALYVETCPKQSNNSDHGNGYGTWQSQCTYRTASVSGSSVTFGNQVASGDNANYGNGLRWPAFPQACFYGSNEGDHHHFMKRLCIVGTWGNTYAPTTAQALARELVVFQ